MPVELFFSNRIEQLACLLADGLYNRQAGMEAVLLPARVVVPNRNLGKWLQLSLARRLGVSMNIEFTFLDTALWDLLVNLAAVVPPPLPADGDIYSLALLRVFEHLPENAPLYDPIRTYLRPAAEDSSAPSDTRRWQLAARLAKLFLEYELNRPDWIPAWQTGRHDGGGMAACQAALYRETLVACGELGNALERPIRSLPHLAQEVLDGRIGASPPPKARRAPTIDIFGLSQISAFHIEMIHRLQAQVAFRVFALNPSEAFWEDVRTPRERRWEAKRRGGEHAAAEDLDDLLPEGPFDLDDHPLLALWGKPGRENIRQLCELSDYDFKASFRPPDRPDSLLGRLQESLRTADADADTDREGDGDGAPLALAQDSSIQVVACPGRLREVETVYARILYQLEQDPHLQTTDIAVLVPAMTAYKPVFDAVFQRSPRRLRYNLVDTLAETESHYGRGVLALLDLMAGRFSRAEVVGLMMNPLFLARWSVDITAMTAWAAWIEALNIYHSFDPHEKTAGGGTPSPRYTWQQGLRRLRLGRIMETEEMGADGGTAWEGLQPYADLESADLQLLERFCLAVENLHHNVVRLRGLAVSDPAWPRAFRATCEALLPIGPESGGEIAIRQSLGEAFETLQDFAALPSPSGATPPGVISCDLLRAFLCGHLRGLSTAHGEYLTGGVTLAALQPMRPIPYEIIYILGMEEGSGFPGRADNSSLDLRLARRRRGDVSTPERNHYLFLEALLSARRQVVISYVCRDLQKDRDQMPCAPVHQLKRYIADHLLGDGARFEEQRIPLKGTDPAYLGTAPSPAWADPLVNDSLLDRIIALRTTGNWPPPEGSIPAQMEARVAALTRPPSASVSAAREAEAGAVRIFIDELARFVRNPIPAKLTRHLGVRAVRPPLEALLETNDEPFSAAFPTDFLVVREALELWLADCWRRPDRPPRAEDRFRRVYDGRALQGDLPEGVFAQLDRRRLERQMVSAADTLRPLLAEIAAAQKRYVRLVLGHRGPATASTAGLSGEVPRLPPVLLAGDPGGSGPPPSCPELSGEMRWLWQDAGGAWHSLVLTGGRAGPPRHPSYHLISPLITYLALRCADPLESSPGAGGLTLHLAAQGGVRPFRYQISAQRAQKYLQYLTRRYLDPHHYRWLPFEVLTQGRLKVQELAPHGVDNLQRQRFLEILLEAWDEGGDYLSRLVRPRFDLNCLDEAHQRVAVYFANEED
jgi:exodeoxyribonuclease V gamma subunit